MTLYKVYVDGICVKEYRHRVQAVIYLLLKGFGCRAKGKIWLLDNVRIEETNNE